MDGPTIRTVFGNELRGALRDRTLTTHFIVIPLLLYPVLLWLGITVALLYDAGSEDTSYRVGISPGLDPALAGELRADPSIDAFFASSGAETGGPGGGFDATAGPVPGGDGLPGGCVITADLSTDRGRTAAAVLEDLARDVRAAGFARLRDSLGIGRAEWEVFRISTSNEAGGRDMGGFILGLLLPATFAVMVSIGCFYTAVDATAGERERGTIETLLSTGADRFSILAGKYLSVLVSGMTSGLLNTASMILCVSAILGPLLRSEGEEISFAVEPGAAFSAVFASALLSALLSALMIASSSLARNYKEGQAMVTPVYLLSVLPVIFMQDPSISFSVSTAAVPVLNAALLLRDSLTGPAEPLPMVISAVSTALFCLAALWAASSLLSREEAAFPGEATGKRSLYSLLRGRRNTGHA